MTLCVPHTRGDEPARMGNARNLGPGIISFVLIFHSRGMSVSLAMGDLWRRCSLKPRRHSREISLEG